MAGLPTLTFSLRRLSSIHLSNEQIFRQAVRHFSNPKAVPQLSRRPTVSDEPTLPTDPCESNTNVDATSHNDNLHGTPETHNVGVDVDAAVEQEEDCSINSYYSRLLNSKLDSCPLQPFNEGTNIIWSALYGTAYRERSELVESMSRWEQIQRGYVNPDSLPRAQHQKGINKDKHRYNHEQFRFTQWSELIVDVNDLLQTHDSLDDIVENAKPTTSLTLAKATGSLNLNDAEQEETPTMEMRNDLKWKKRMMKLHIKAKRRDKMRMKRKMMAKRTQK